MLTEDFCSYEVAKLLKEKGFDTFKPYGWDEELFDKEHPRNFSLGFDSKEHWISCPTHQMAMKWLRKVHNQHVQINYLHGAYQEFDYVVINTFNGKAYHEPVSFSTYEEAVEVAIKYCLENLI